MRLLLSSRPMSTRTASSSLNRSMAWSVFTTLLLISSIATFLSPSSFLAADAALTPGFCGDCQTFANAIGVCGGSFNPSDIEINGPYNPPHSASKCVCTEVMQKVLWTCARCELLNGHSPKAPPPTAFQTQCISWGMTPEEWKAPYTGVVAPGTQSELGAGSNPPNPSGGNGGTNPSGGKGNPGGSGTASGSAGTLPTNADNATAGTESKGPSGAAIGISLGILGVAMVAGVVAVVMMKRRRRRHTPLELDGTYMGLDDQTWEKPRPASPPMPPAPIASGAPVASRGPMQGRPSPFESRPGGGGSVVGGYDGQYEQYDQYNHHGGGYNDGYNDGYGGHGHGQYVEQYDQGYGQGYPPHEYGYDQHAAPTSGPPVPSYHAGADGKGGQYL